MFLFVPARLSGCPVSVQYSEEVTWCPCLILSSVSAHAFRLGSELSSEVYMVTSDRGNIIILVKYDSIPVTSYDSHRRIHTLWPVLASVAIAGDGVAGTNK